MSKLEVGDKVRALSGIVFGITLCTACNRKEYTDLSIMEEVLANCKCYICGGSLIEGVEEDYKTLTEILGSHHE